MRSCISGGTIRMTRPFGSRSTASSSLTIRASKTRPPHVSRSSCWMLRAASANRTAPISEHDRDGVQRTRPDVAGQEHRLQARDQIARGHDQREPLDDGRHAVDLEEEARKQERRQEAGDQRHLPGHELVLRRGRDQQALAQRRDQERAESANSARTEPRNGTSNRKTRQRARRAPSRPGRARSTARTCRAGARARWRAWPSAPPSCRAPTRARRPARSAACRSAS